MRLLIAEDDPTSAAALHGLLQNIGYDVDVATNGIDAWQRWQISQPKIVILDWMMPGIDGVEVCRRIRSVSTNEYTCVIMLTAKRDREDRVAALKAGADVFLTKPLNKEELIARLQVAERIIEMEAECSKSQIAA